MRTFTPTEHIEQLAGLPVPDPDPESRPDRAPRIPCTCTFTFTTVERAMSPDRAIDTQPTTNRDEAHLVFGHDDPRRATEPHQLIAPANGSQT